MDGGGEGLSGEAGKSLHFCLGLGLHRTGLGSELEKSMHGAITQRLGYMGSVCGGMGRGWRLGLIHTCPHLAREATNLCFSFAV